ncbi:MAG: V-type ATP synthase subunit E [Ruminococcus sp.]|nr:V-type ATP synthase subunit E [Ruminococcus sp.]
MPKNTTDNFLQAIKKYAKTQKTAMQDEVRQLKTERLKEAEEKAKLDSQRLIKETLNEKRSRQTAQLAKKTQEGQRELFVARSAMVKDIFDAAEKKLMEYTISDAYAEKLFANAKEIADLFDGNDCVLYVNERDIKYSDKLTDLFQGNVKIESDATIKIGGIKAFCESMGMIADETLDSKLEEQREWFVENSNLRVL